MFSRRRIAALAAEFLGTGVLAFVVLAVSRSQIGIAYFVAIAAGMTVVFMGLALNRDVQLNPAITLGMWTARRNSTVKTILYIAMQILGGMAAYSLFKYFSRTPIQALPSQFDAHVLFAEAFGTFIFAFVAAGVAYQRQHWLVRSVVTGGGLTLGIMVASVASAAFLNPAVALAANGWVWGTYVAGPVLGAIVGVNLYGLLFATRDKLVTGVAETASSVTSPVKGDSKLLAKEKAERSDAVVEDDDDEDDDEVATKEEKREKASSKASKKSSKKKKK